MTTYARPRTAGLVATREAAAILGVTVDTIFRYCSEGRLTEAEAPVGRRPRFFDRQEVKQFAARRESAPQLRRWHGLDLSVLATDERFRDRFWSKVSKDGPVPLHRPDLGPCWTWTRYCDKAGYGKFPISKGQFGLTHAISYALTVGAVPPRLHVCHHCDNPPCVRPDHLFLGTSRDNALDCLAKGRANRARGVDTFSARLDEDAVRSIRAVEPYHGRFSDLARKHGVSATTIRSIINGTKWSHVA